MRFDCRGPWATVLVSVVAAGLYLNTWSHGFHYDDFHSLVNNPHIRSLAEVPAYLRDPTLFSSNPESAMYRPVLLVSYALNYAVGGLQPAGYHLVNALLHGLNAGLVHRLLLGLGQGGLALPAAFIFGLSPVNAEAVNYVSSRSELLMASFFLLACLVFLRGGRSGGGLGLGAGVLALLTKSVAVVLVPILGLCEWFRGGWPALRRRWPLLLAFGILALGYVLFTRELVGQALLDPIRPHEVQFWTQVKAGVYYLLLLVMPVHLSVEHQFFPARGPGEGAVLAAALLLSLFLALWPWKRGRFAAGWVLLLLLPTALVPLVVLVNEHRLYLAVVGFALVLAWALGEMVLRGRPVAREAIGLYNIVLALLVLERNQAWVDELSLWQDAASKAPQMLKPHLRLGDALVGQGRLAEAEAEYLQAVALRPQHPGARNNLGSLYMKQGRLPQAQAQFAALLQFSPDNIPARLNLGAVLLAQGRWQEAAEQYRQALVQGEMEGEAEEKLGLIALNYQRVPDQALDHFDRALARHLHPQLLVLRGVALRALQRPVEAEAAYRQALSLDTGCLEAWFNLGNLCAERGDRPGAAAAFRQVVQLAPASELGRRAAGELEKTVRP